METVEKKIDGIRGLLKEHGYDGVLIRKRINYSYLTMGRDFVNITSDVPIANIYIDADDSYLISNNIEAQRLKDEEGCGSYKLITYPWYQEKKKDEIIAGLTAGKKVVTDSDMENDIKGLRYTLCDEEIEEYRSLGKDTAEALESVCFNVKQGMTEYEMAGIISAEMMKRGIYPAVNLVGSDDRALMYRHLLPTGKVLEKYAILSVSGLRRGIFASATRTICFGEPDEELMKRFNAVIYIDAGMIDFTRPGRTARDMFYNAVSLYESKGYPKEWENHHQGGLCGYNSREYKINPDSNDIVKENQVFAWNPTVQGTKSEDTFIVGSNGNDIITQTGNFVYKEINIGGHTYKRPDILIRRGN